MRRTVSGLLKLLYPHGDFDKDAVEKCLKYALESRRRVKEQLKKIGGMEFYDVHFSYIDNESMEETFVSVLEQGELLEIARQSIASGLAVGRALHLDIDRLSGNIPHKQACDRSLIPRRQPTAVGRKSEAS